MQSEDRPHPIHYAESDANLDRAREDDDRPALALFVVHGMGQQSRFDTIDLIVEGMIKHGVVPDKPRARTVQVEGIEPVQRTEIGYTSKDVEKRLDVYEAYWAPLTQGAVSILDVMTFLFAAAWNGIQKGRAKFSRWLFQRPADFHVPGSTIVELGLATMTLAALAVMNVVIVAVVVAHKWTETNDRRLLDDLETVVVFVIVNVVLFILVLVLCSALRLATLSRIQFLADVFSSLGFVTFFGALAAIMLGGWYFLIVIAHHTLTLPVRLDGTWIWIGLIIAALAFGVGTLWKLARPATSAATTFGVAIAALGLFGMSLEWFRPFVGKADGLTLWQNIFYVKGPAHTILGVFESHDVLSHWWPWIGVGSAFVLLMMHRAAVRRSGKSTGILVFFATIAAVFSSPLLVWLIFNRVYTWGVNRWHFPTDELVRPALGFALMFAASWWIKNFLIQYIGDVAAYVSSFRLDRFFKLRKEIQDTAAGVAHTIFSCRRKNSEPLYESVLFAGHSLGSVIVYDTLNRMLIDENLGLKMASGVRNRVKLLLTFGSPLNKIAYLFTAQSTSAHIVREQLASAVQPLIDDPTARAGLKWVNVWTPNDIISGHLDYFDRAGSPNPVVNMVDEEGNVPVAAHTSYWNDKLMYRVIADWL